MKNNEKKQKSPVIIFKGKKYIFLTRTLISFPIGIIITVVSMIQIIDNVEIVWLHELFAKHMVFFLNLIFNLGAQTSYLPEFPCPWHTTIPGNVTVYINNGCTGLTAMSIFVAIIIFTPHSQDPKTNEDIIWRKIIDIFVTLTLIYLFNVFRAVIQFYLYSRGFSWSLLHNSLGTLAIIIVVHISIFLFCNRIIPELFISIFYSGKLIYIKIYIQVRKEDIAEIYNGRQNRFKTEEIDLYIIKKYEIKSRLIHFLKENKNKYTAKAMKNRLFAKQEKITEDLLDKMLDILVNAKVVLSENLNSEKYYFI